LEVWQRARELVSAVYALTRLLPGDERHVIIPQLRRAAWSVSCNIAEGNAKLGARELRRYLDSALGSLAEIDAIVTVLGDLYRLDTEVRDRIDTLRVDITRKIFGILKAGSRR
jgi:four helix bundle protein